MGMPAAQSSNEYDRDFQPCLRLLAALLEDAYTVRDLVACYEARGRKVPSGLYRQYTQDRQWVRNSDELRPFSFGWVCLVLGLEPVAVRRAYFNEHPSGFARQTAAAPPRD